ncbi:putative intramembrane protease [Cladobotryum mycophilum]|uniref:Intramembrane protease n=1 Tax=Cladobotryum mycophilum TaxID=491253 RepID=A0ABR0SFS8_9HYPO
MLELKLICGVMGIIYLGAHASLRRPPSAAASKSKKGKKRDQDEAFTQGLELSDAVLFPLMAAVMLIGLYYLIQWLQDPAILNKILRWYMSTVSIASLVTIYAHGLELGTSFIFPSYWRGSDGSLRKVDQKKRTVAVCDNVGNQVEQSPATSNPFPGLLALLAPSERLRNAAWSLRDLLTRHWVLKFFVHGMGDEEIQVKFAHMMAMFMSVGTALVYFATSSLTLSNMLGYGMCYCSFLVLSPTDFLIGSLVLSGLFFYDIVMVFYTPYMVTVATMLDVPIKLTFEAAERRSILGLGDIVVPGILIGWALRLDLWIHYAKRIKHEPVDLKIKSKDITSGEIIETTETKQMEVKVPYLNVKGNWGERWWTRGTMFLSLPRELPVEVAASSFSKTYFYASMVGYGLGMIFTLVMLLVFKRGQPALLYLVPGVLGSLLLTSVARGEFSKMWTYTEDGSIDKMDIVVDLDANGNVIKTFGKPEDGTLDLTKDKKTGDKKAEKGDEKEEKKGEGDEKDEDKRGKKGHHVFLLSLEAPSDDED